MQVADREDEGTIETPTPGVTMSFNYFVSTIQGGDLHAELSKKLQEMGAALSQSLIDFGGVPKGEISLKFKFKLEKGVVHVAADHAIKLPKVPEAGALLFIDGRNNLCLDNPRQLNMGFPRTGPRAVS